MTAWLVRGAHLYNPLRGTTPRADVRIRDDTITQIGRALQPSPGEQVFDASGMTAVPSMIDLHVHSTRPNDLTAYADAGIRHIRYAGLDLDSVRAARRHISSAEGRPLSISSCGPMLDMADEAYPEWTIVADSPASAAATARSLIAGGEVDALIVTQGISGPLISAISAQARRAGFPVVGQVWKADAAEAARAGIDQLDNSSRIFASLTVSVPQMLAYRSVGDRLATWARAWASVDWPRTEHIQDVMIEHGVSYCPTLVAHEVQSFAGDDILMRDPRFEAWFDAADREAYRRFRAYLEAGWSQQNRSEWAAAMDNRLEWIRRFRSRGGKIVVGTDLPFGALNVIRELELLTESGMTNDEALFAATQGSADALGASSFSARIEAGAEASFVLTQVSPADSISALREPAAVFLKGRRMPARTDGRDAAGTDRGRKISLTALRSPNSSVKES